VERGITTAVLVRTNKTGKTIVDFLRTKCPEIMTVHEGKGGIMDNAVVPLIMAVIHIAAHPDDTMSWMHLRMSPLAPIIDEMWKNKSQSSLSLLKELHEGGFQKFIRKWTHLLAQNVVLQPFETKRLNDLALAASIFDTTGSRDCNRFVKFIEAYETTEIASEKCVRVMTIHQAKGLEFDLVILPELDGNSWHEVKDPFLIATDDEDNINWILKMPHKQVVEADPQLSTYLKKHEADSFFEELRLFYVAMTRAKRALYMVVPYAGESAKAFNSARFVRIQLTGNPVSNNSGEPGPKIIYERGEPSWYEKLPPQEPQPQTQPSVVYFPPDYMTKTSIPLQFMRLEPARQTVRELNGKILFASSTWEAIESGNAVHNIMKKIEWWDEAKFNDLISVILKTANPNDKILQRAIRICKEALASQEIQSVFKKPEGNVELWREKSFEVIVGQKLISGRFDRVVIMKNASGKPAGADIVDFKTEDIENTKQLLLAKERYKNQINLYREALSRILEIPEQQCRILLVFTSVKKVISAP
jgi:ATP-dependent helicase/nuclease subunit A